MQMVENVIHQCLQYKQFLLANFLAIDFSVNSVSLARQYFIGSHYHDFSRQNIYRKKGQINFVNKEISIAF